MSSCPASAAAAIERGDAQPEIRFGELTLGEQQALVETIAKIIQAAPLYTPTMPRTGKPMSVRMTNCGALGWVTDRDGGYRYQATHPITGQPWPKMPRSLEYLWHKYAGIPASPEACLVNVYSAEARMGLHRDEDEETLDAPVLSISLGDDCLFRIGGKTRGGLTRSCRLRSGDVVLLAGENRLAYHGVDRIYPGTSTLNLPQGARINLTLRRVQAWAPPTHRDSRYGRQDA